VSHPLNKVIDMSSENPTGAENQQERSFDGSDRTRSRGSVTRSSGERNPQRPYARLSVERTEMKRWSMPRGDMWRTQNYNRPKVAKFLVG
jgi:hypothetical protein